MSSEKPPPSHSSRHGASRDNQADSGPISPSPRVEGPFENVEKLRARDPQVADALVAAYLPQVLRASRGAGLGQEEAEEVTQETFLTFFEAVSRFEGRSKVRTFLFGILYRKISERRRGLARDRRHDSIDSIMESRFSPNGSWSRPPKPADHGLRRRELRVALTECIETAPESQRMAFHLREVEGLSTEEICKILDVSTTNLGVMLYRIRNRARECLESKGMEN
ncbi:MAG: sigma-70 family RNA polymerase sigma factor [Thermoanaerobaculia bacterium]|nr:sigma-70 family RNA polymerase sigma factor [Thermoanaerobaculia bacterium]